MLQAGPELIDIESMSSIKGLSQMGSAVAITVIICVVLVKYVLPFFERALNSVLNNNKTALDTIVASYDKFLIKVSENLEKSLSSLSADIRELRTELRADLKDRTKGE